jgi:hypothetical protein
MKVPVDYNIGYEGGTFCTQVIYEEEELPRVGGLEKVLIDGKERLVEITKIAPMVVFAGSARVPIGGKIVPPEAKPFVRFLNRKTRRCSDIGPHRRHISPLQGWRPCRTERGWRKRRKVCHSARS